MYMYMCIPGFELSQLRAALVAQLVEHSPRMWSVVGSNPTQGSFFFKKRESCPGCISLPLLACHVHVHVQYKRASKALQISTCLTNLFHRVCEIHRAPEEILSSRTWL